MTNGINIDIAKLTPYINQLSLKNKIFRACWSFVYIVLFRPLKGRLFNPWRIFLLQCFGAKFKRGCQVHATVQIWAPWNLDMGAFVCLGPHSICYNADKVSLGTKVCVSQYAYLCTASHDITKLDRPLITGPISVGNYAWICADAFISPSITIGDGAVVGARAVVTKDVEPWTVVGGNPARFIKNRVIEDIP